MKTSGGKQKKKKTYTQETGAKHTSKSYCIFFPILFGGDEPLATFFVLFSDDDL